MKIKRIITGALAALLTGSMAVLEAFAIQPATDIIYSGIDVSEYQGDIDFTAVSSSGIKAVYIRAGADSDYTDPFFEQNYKKAASEDIYYGFYYYVSAASVGEAEYQAQRFAALIAGTKYSLRPAMDFEVFGSLTRSEINEIGLAFLNKLEELTDITPAIYTDAYNAENLWSTDFGKYYLWIADWGGTLTDNPVWDSWHAFQYSDEGRTDGIYGLVDLDKITSGMRLSDTEMGASTQPSAETTVQYTVVKGDTLWAIANKYGVSVSEIAEQNSIANPSLIFPGQILSIITKRAESNIIKYTVKSGDTLWAIASKYNTTVSVLASYNKIANPSLIYAGEAIYIPERPAAPNYTAIYTVKSGDTLWSIANYFGTTVSAIAAGNNISNPSLIYPGEVFKIY